MLCNVQKVAGVARQTVEARYRHHVAGAQVIEHPGQFRPLGVRARDLLRKDARAAGGFQLGALIRQVLVVGADAGIAQQQLAAHQVERAGVGGITHRRVPVRPRKPVAGRPRESE